MNEVATTGRATAADDDALDPWCQEGGNEEATAVSDVGTKGSLVRGFKKKAELLRERGRETAENASAKLREKAESLKERGKERSANRRADSLEGLTDGVSGEPANVIAEEAEERVGDAFGKSLQKASMALGEQAQSSDDDGRECTSLLSPPGLAETADKPLSGSADIAEKVVAANRDAAQKAVEATKKAAEDARRGAEETAGRLKAAFQIIKTDSSGASTEGSRPMALIGTKLGRAMSGDDATPSESRQLGLKLFSGKKDDDSKQGVPPPPSVLEVAEVTRDILVAPVKAGAAAVRHIEKKLSKGASDRNTLTDTGRSMSNITSEDETIPLEAESSRQRSSVSSGQDSASAEDSIASNEGGDESRMPRFTCYLSKKGTLVIGPVLEFAVRDSTILSAASVIAVIFTYKSIPMIVDDNVLPLKTALSWTLLGFLSGFHWTFLCSRASLFSLSISDKDAASEELGVSEAEGAAILKSPERMSPSTIIPRTASGPDNHKLFNQTVRRVTGIRRISYAKRDVSAPLAPLRLNGFWSCLVDIEGRKKLPWEEHVGGCSENDTLHKRLLRFNDFRVKKRGSEWSGGSMIANVEASATSEGAGEDARNGISSDGQLERSLQPFGGVRMRNKSMETLSGDFVVDPLCRLRGMDIFQTDCPEEEICKHRLLTRMGMRKVPTFLVNIMAPWANVVVYFQMPEWVKRFGDIKETEGDSQDTKSLKRFLTGDDEYRNQRLKILPSLVDGPFPIRMMAPAKKEVTISCDSLPLTWHFRNETSSNGSSKAAMVEVDIDLVTSKSVRKFASLVRPHTARIIMDCALVISKPWDSEDDEPSACLGMWRLDKVDLNGCAVLPKTESEMVHEASVLMETIREMPSEVAVAAG